MQTPSKVVEISPARGRDERSLKWIAMACVIVYLVSLGSIFGMAMMAVQASKEVHVDSESGALVGAGTGQPVAVDPITDFQINLSYELPFLSMTYLANVASLEFKYVDANNIILPAAYQIHAVRKTAEGRATFLTAVGDKITVDGSNGAAFLESDGVSHMIIVDDGRSAAMDKGYVYDENAKRHDAIVDPHAAVYDGDAKPRDAADDAVVGRPGGSGNVDRRGRDNGSWSAVKPFRRMAEEASQPKPDAAETKLAATKVEKAIAKNEHRWMGDEHWMKDIPRYHLDGFSTTMKHGFKKSYH